MVKILSAEAKMLFCQATPEWYGTIFGVAFFPSTLLITDLKGNFGAIVDCSILRDYPPLPRTSPLFADCPQRGLLRTRQ
jgi:hypothetical protein